MLDSQFRRILYDKKNNNDLECEFLIYQITITTRRKPCLLASLKAGLVVGHRIGSGNLQWLLHSPFHANCHHDLVAMFFAN